MNHASFLTTSVVDRVVPYTGSVIGNHFELAMFLLSSIWPPLSFPLGSWLELPPSPNDGVCSTSEKNNTKIDTWGTRLVWQWGFFLFLYPLYFSSCLSRAFYQHCLVWGVLGLLCPRGKGCLEPRSLNDLDKGSYSFRENERGCNPGNGLSTTFEVTSSTTVSLIEFHCPCARFWFATFRHTKTNEQKITGWSEVDSVG